jgi:diacylglycerol O-acyltransferase / trehalose O-mycolyltransferase
MKPSTVGNWWGQKVFADAAKAAGVPISFVVRPEGAHTQGLFDSER